MVGRVACTVTLIKRTDKPKVKSEESGYMLSLCDWDNAWQSSDRPSS